jgi:hypothetical protein
MTLPSPSLTTLGSLSQALRGPFCFLRPDPEEIRRLTGDARDVFPEPQKVFLHDEAAAAVPGFPVLISEDLRLLSQALVDYVQAEEALQLATTKRQGFDRRRYDGTVQQFRGLFRRAIENVTSSAYGSQHAAVFWLWQSLEVSRLLRETPKRLLRLDLSVGRQHGDSIKYAVLDRYLEVAFAETYDAVQVLARRNQENEESLFPTLLQRMRDNVLILTETHISRDLSELTSYFAGHLRLDGKDFRQRLSELEEWHGAVFARDPDLRAVAALLGERPGAEAKDLLLRSGYVTFLSARRDYQSARLLPPAAVQIWESLLTKLKEFELLQALRRVIVPLEQRGDDLMPIGAPAKDASSAAPALALSAATRPLDFMTPWVINPIVDRCGLIYDISNFSEILAVLGWSGVAAQDTSFRMIFQFQRHVTRLAAAQRLNLEKYLGDGAFYSGRDARRMLVAALRIQRHYAQVLDEGFPFNRGMRIALAWGQYRMLPIHGTSGTGPERYEFYGQGLVELSRLVSGKSAREVDEIKNLLIGLGYPEGAVNRFFAPLVESNVDVIDKREEARRFYAYLNSNGTLINEGIVATAGFVTRFAREGGFSELWRAEDDGRGYIVAPIDGGGDVLRVGVRKLGTASLKGLERQSIYEVVDADRLECIPADHKPAQLLTALEAEFAHQARRRRSDHS